MEVSKACISHSSFSARHCHPLLLHRRTQSTRNEPIDEINRQRRTHPIGHDDREERGCSLGASPSGEPFLRIIPTSPHRPSATCHHSLCDMSNGSSRAQQVFARALIAHLLSSGREFLHPPGLAGEVDGHGDNRVSQKVIEVCKRMAVAEGLDKGVGAGDGLQGEEEEGA
jgi:hypothetical protein